jgi:hypothetical protein
VTTALALFIAWTVLALAAGTFIGRAIALADAKDEARRIAEAEACRQRHPSAGPWVA